MVPPMRPPTTAYLHLLNPLHLQKTPGLRYILRNGDVQEEQEAEPLLIKLSYPGPLASVLSPSLSQGGMWPGGHQVTLQVVTR